MRKEFPRLDPMLELKKYRYWTLHLSDGQYFLGRLMLILNRKNVVDFCDLRPGEMKELNKVMKQCRKALTKCFKPDLFNYASLGNKTCHHHWHIIPRYKSKRKVNGMIFEDKLWGKPPWKLHARGKRDKKTMQVIHDRIVKEL